MPAVTCKYFLLEQVVVLLAARQLGLGRGHCEGHRERQRRVVDRAAVHQESGLCLRADEGRQASDLPVPGQGRRAVHSRREAKRRVGLQEVVPVAHAMPGLTSEFGGQDRFSAPGKE